MSDTHLTDDQLVALRQLNDASKKLTTSRERFERALQDLFEAWPHFPRVRLYEWGLPRDILRRATPENLPGERGDPPEDQKAADKAMQKVETETKAFLKAREQAESVAEENAGQFMEPLKTKGEVAQQRLNERNEARDNIDVALENLIRAWPDFNRRKLAHDTGFNYRSLLNRLKNIEDPKSRQGDPNKAWDETIQAFEAYTQARIADEQAKIDRYEWIKTTRIATVGLVSIFQIADAVGVQYSWLRQRLADDGFDNTAKLQSMAKKMLSEQAA